RRRGNLPTPSASRSEDTPFPELFDQFQEKPSCQESNAPFWSTLTSHVLKESIVPVKSLGKSANLRESFEVFSLSRWDVLVGFIVPAGHTVSSQHQGRLSAQKPLAYPPDGGSIYGGLRSVR